MAMSRSLLECGHDEERDDDFCSYCASDGKLQPALYFCFDCSVYGKFICGTCLKYHTKFVIGHEVEKLSNHSTSRRTKGSEMKLKALQESNEELQRDRNNFQKEKETLLIDIKEVKKENEKLTEELRDCKVGRDKAVDASTTTEELERIYKRDIEHSFIVKERNDLNEAFMHTSKSPKPLIVAAIELGTTYSGWSYSSKYDFDRDPVRVQTKVWTNFNFFTHKAPTCVLIRPDGKTFHSFGYDAEGKYLELAMDGEHMPWFFFKHFSKDFMRKNETESKIMIKDASGKQLEVRTVFALVIKYLKDDLESYIKQRIPGIIETNIHWVLTVPRDCTPAAKQLMVNAAEEAGIKNGQLTIVLESQAAFLFCRYLSAGTILGQGSLAGLQAGEKYMLLDVGGESTRITVFQVVREGIFRVVYAASDVAIGGTTVDVAFEAFLTEICGSDVFKHFKDHEPDDYRDLCENFEIMKRDIKPNISEMKLKFPISLIKLATETNKRSIQEYLSISRFKNQVKWKRDRLVIEYDILKSCFEIPLKSIYNHVQKVLVEQVVHGCSTIIMVGGFSESKMLQEYIKKGFPDKNLLIPEEAGLAVLKGAAIFGHTFNMTQW